ncbi:MAG TPA: phosphonate C-P lyase system protein PhnH [Caulobacteraceae bacterium]|jgi:alpha-D-ribose 1-methylphosphonate 5-triphosphate synthase subunit PhnH
MSPALDLDKIRPAFRDPVRDSQTVFRQVMDAVARPGSQADLGAIVEPPAGLDAAAAAVALTLFDFETTVWLDAVLSGGEAEAWLRFHCGCPLVSDPAKAAFALISDAKAAPALSAFNPGDAKYPDRSTTVIVQVESLDGGRPVTLTGPGIKDSVTVAPKGLPEGFWAQMQDNNSKFQFGVDVVIVSGQTLIATPRSSHIQIQGG